MVNQPARPRPRPRVVSKQPTANSGDAPVDEDDLFRRNKGRTTEQWKQLQQSDAKARPFTISADDWEVEDYQEDMLVAKVRKKKRPIKQNGRPHEWRAMDVARMLHSDDEDNDIQIVERTSENITEGTSPSKRKRQRSRSASRSITPPPKLSDYQRESAMHIVRQALAYRPRSLSPALVLDDSSDIELDPELAKISEAMKQHVNNAGTTQGPAGGPETVVITVRWRPHPRNPMGQEQCWTFDVKRHETLRELFDEVADLAGVMVDQLVISQDHRRVFASGTPHSLHMWAEGEMEACDKQTAEYLRAQQTDRRISPSGDDIPSARSPSMVPQSELDFESEAESIGDTIKLVFRSAATKDKTFPLTVRSTTTCGAIVKAFLKVAGLPDNYSHATPTKPLPQLMVDGDRMDSEAEIGDADLEDGDLVEIIGV